MKIGKEAADGKVEWGVSFSDIFDDAIECPSPSGNRKNHGCQARCLVICFPPFCVGVWPVRSERRSTCMRPIHIVWYECARLPAEMAQG